MAARFPISRLDFFRFLHEKDTIVWTNLLALRFSSGAVLACRACLPGSMGSQGPKSPR